MQGEGRQRGRRSVGACRGLHYDMATVRTTGMTIRHKISDTFIAYCRLSDRTITKGFLNIKGQVWEWKLHLSGLWV
ncbi:hypothetical protein SKAU_G00337810 [Synaphobranchus kaupii]|uniref:Uncharacterized protein n=1 Tax=Synaphobranchus kaupii TaxID=118154 RepID=A0A9Q1II78_SYNKA|nr:hypothetical protein SKAU_G00337810 [Synaphobranchus kaupii]